MSIPTNRIRIKITVIGAMNQREEARFVTRLIKGGFEAKASLIIESVKSFEAGSCMGARNSNLNQHIIYFPISLNLPVDQNASRLDH